MQFKTSLTLLAAALPAALATLPKTFELFVFENGQQVGCINGYGKFTSNLQWCLPFGSKVTTDPYSTIYGYSACEVSSIGNFSCYETTGANEFYVIGPDLTLKDAVDATWSTDTLPVDGDTVGVSIFVGSDHDIKFNLQVHAVSG